MLACLGVIQGGAGCIPHSKILLDTVTEINAFTHMQEHSFDYVVIGSGPGGYVSAIRAAQLGLKTAVIERSETGGVCLNWGCIPTKALLTSAHLYHSATARNSGLIIEGSIKPDVPAMVDHSRKTAKRLSSGIEFLFKKYNVTLLRGLGYIETSGKIFVKDESGQITDTVNAVNTVIATGARPREIGNLKFSDNVMSSREAMLQQQIPETLLVIGAGAIGMEFADFYNAIGSRVTLVEVADHILPLEEADAASVVKKSMEKRGMEIREKAMVKSLVDTGTSVAAEIEWKGQTSKEVYSKALLAVGVSPNVEGFGFENTGGILERGFVSIDEMCRVKGARNLYAIGDVTGGKQLAHKASHEGVIAAEHAAGLHPHSLNQRLVPGCTYTTPQVASVGYREAELKEKGIPYTTGSFPFSASGKALAMKEGEGFAKVFLHAQTGEVLGAHLSGADVTELISNYALGMTSELTAHEFLATVFPHPTLSEAVHESMGVALGVSCNF